MMTDTGNNTEGVTSWVSQSKHFNSNIAGTEQGTATDVDHTGSDEIVLLKLQGVEYTIWVWLHVLLIAINMVFLFAYIMREGMW